MDRKDAYRRLADVVNLTDGVEHAERVVDRVDAKVSKAKDRLDDAKAAKAKAVAALETERARLAAAQELVAEIPDDMVADVVNELSAKRATRDRYIEALAAAGDGDDQARRAVLAAAEAAGATPAFAGVAEGNGEGLGV